MSQPYSYGPPARGAFQGYWMPPGSYSGVPAWLVLEGGWVALMAPGQSPSGYVDVFRVPVHQVRVSSAAQRITVKVAGTSYHVLARPLGPIIGGSIGVAGSVAGLAGAESLHAGAGIVRLGNVAADSSAFSQQGGHQFLAAMRAAGAHVSRFGYCAIMALGLAVAILVAILFLVIVVAVMT